jgi:hypothetical protein
MKLTDSKIKGLRPQTKLYRVTDGQGLTLEVTPTGSKLWRYRFRLHGKPNMLALGAYPGVSLADARKKRDEAAELVGRGINPAHHRKTQEVNTFRAIAEEYLTDQAAKPGLRQSPDTGPILSRIRSSATKSTGLTR